MARIVFLGGEEPPTGSTALFYPLEGVSRPWQPEPLRWCSPENEPAFNGQSGRSPLLPLKQSYRAHRSQFHGLSAESTASGQPLVSRSARSSGTIVSALRHTS